MNPMGLDIVELIMRTEEVFSIDLPDAECEKVHTVGDLYRLVLDKLTLPYTPSIEIESPSLGVARPLHKARQLVPWTTPDVWQTLKFLIHEELGINADRITEAAAFIDDLGCD